MHVHHARPVAGLATQSQTFYDLFTGYESTLVRTRYHGIVARLHLHSTAHVGLTIVTIVSCCIRRAMLDRTSRTRH